MLRDFHTKRYTGASFSKSIQKSLVGLKILTRDQMHTGSGSTVETLSDMVCGANYCAVSEPMGQHSVSSKTGSDGCAVLAMD